MSMLAASSPSESAPAARLQLELTLEEDDVVVSGSAASPPPSRRDNPREAPLRAAVKAIQHEAARDKDAFELLHEVCQETLQCRARLAKLYALAPLGRASSSVESENDDDLAAIAAASAPKSPQERLMALVPTAIDKGKTRYHRRAAPTEVGAAASPRWRTVYGDTRPITDIAVIFASDMVPEGYIKLERSPSGTRADINRGARGEFVYLCVSKDTASSKPPVSDIIAIFPERGEFVPTDYEYVTRRGVPANLNTGTQGEKIHLCVRRSASTSIVDVTILFPKKGDRLPYGYMKVDQTPNGHVADLNSNSGGTEVFICYKKKLSCLGELRKAWLHTTMLGQDDSARSPKIAPYSNDAIPLPKVNVEESPTDPAGKLTEMRDIEVAAASSLSDVTPSASLEYYMYPILLACYTRHGPIAEMAFQVLGQCLDAGLFDEAKSDFSSCPLGVVIDGITASCQQAIKSRFISALPLFRKVIRKNVSGFHPALLHSILKALTFIGDMDAALVKSVEDELIYKIMNRYESEHIQTLSARRIQDNDGPPTSERLVQDFITNLIDDVSSGAEIAANTESCLGVFKSHSSIQSPAFYADTLAMINKLASTTHEKNALQLIVTLSKVVHRKASAAATTTVSESDRWSGSHSLRALNVVLLAAGAGTKEKRLFGQVVRRFILSAVNSTMLIGNHDAFRGNLALISTLWNHYRRHLKVELALVFEHQFLRILLSSAPCAFNYQLDIMHELIPWFQLPPNVVEMFLNFDLDRVQQQWKIFEHLCSTISSIAEGATTNASSPEEDSQARLPIQIQAITTILAITRSVMDASGHAHLINRDPRTRLLSMEVGGWEQDDDTGEALLTTSELCRTGDSSSSSHADECSTSPTKLSKHTAPAGLRFGSMSVRMRNEVQKRNQQILKRAIEISSSKSLKKAIEYLVAMNFVKDTPRDITSFLRIYHDFFDEAEIGDYLGEGDEDFKVQVRLTYVRAISFEGMTLVESLRHFLTNGGFRLPGEAQKIERMVEAFAQCFYEDAPTSFSSADTAMIIAYSIIMLNTDLHNPQVKKNKMSKEQFVKNNRGIDNGKDLPRRYLEEIYEDIARHPMHLKGSRVVPTTSREASRSTRDVENSKFRGNLSKSVAQCEELMKDLSQTYVTFQFVGVDACISPDLIKLLFERVWFSFLTLSTSILGDNQSDLSLTMHCLDLLRYCISTCLFLRMPVERQAFCTLLSKVENALDDSPTPPEEETEADNDTDKGLPDSSGDGERRRQQWLVSVEDAAAQDDPWLAMGDIHVVVNKMKETIQSRQRSQELSSVLRRINRSSYFLKDTTHFVREGDLTKKCRSRTRVYRFFLFNDQLLYADKGMSGYWNPHNSLRLKLTRIADVPDGVMLKHAFQIQNPVKSFIVTADSAAAKAEWMRAIDEAVSEGTKKISRNARRLSTKTGAAGNGSDVAMSGMKALIRRGSRSPTKTSSTAGFLPDSPTPIVFGEATVLATPENVSNLDGGASIIADASRDRFVLKESSSIDGGEQEAPATASATASATTSATTEPGNVEIVLTTDATTM